MPVSPRAPALPSLQLNDTAPIYRQIYTRLRNAIAEQLLRPGERIPAARALAQELGVARGTVEAAYALLIAEGYVETRGQAGTVVAQQLMSTPPSLVPSMPANHSSAAGRIHVSVAAGAGAGLASIQALPFQMGLPALDAFPRKIWARLAARSVRATSHADMLYPPVAGLPSLRAAIATYLQLSRGVACHPEQILITSGYRETLQLIAAAMLTPADQVWVEDPGYPATSAVLQQAGIVTVAVGVDQDGLQVAQGIQTAPHARAVVVTPAHQSPLCVSLSLPRRLALLEWARRNAAWIIEDDYDGEYRYVGRPLPALKSLDQHQRVLYTGTFSKVLFPGVRLAYLVVPETQLPRFMQAAHTSFSGAPLLNQQIVSRFMAEGHFARHLQRMRRLYAERRELATQGLSKVLGHYLQVQQSPGGMHLLLNLPARRSDRALAARLRAAGLAANALSERTLLQRLPASLLLGFTNIDTPASAEHLARRILSVLD